MSMSIDDNLTARVWAGRQIRPSLDMQSNGTWYTGIAKPMAYVELSSYSVETTRYMIEIQDLSQGNVST